MRVSETLCSGRHDSSHLLLWACLTTQHQPWFVGYTYMAGVVCYCLVKTTNSETQETENTSVCNIQTPSMVLLDSFLSDWRGEPYQFHSFTWSTNFKQAPPAISPHIRCHRHHRSPVGFWIFPSWDPGFVRGTRSPRPEMRPLQSCLSSITSCSLTLSFPPHSSLIQQMAYLDVCSSFLPLLLIPLLHPRSSSMLQ